MSSASSSDCTTAIRPGSPVAKIGASLASGVGSGAGRRSTVSASHGGHTITCHGYSTPHCGQNMRSRAAPLVAGNPLFHDLADQRRGQRIAGLNADRPLRGLKVLQLLLIRRDDAAGVERAMAGGGAEPDQHPAVVAEPPHAAGDALLYAPRRGAEPGMSSESPSATRGAAARIVLRSFSSAPRWSASSGAR